MSTAVYGFCVIFVCFRTKKKKKKTVLILKWACEFCSLICCSPTYVPNSKASSSSAKKSSSGFFRQVSNNSRKSAKQRKEKAANNDDVFSEAMSTENGASETSSLCQSEDDAQFLVDGSSGQLQQSAASRQSRKSRAPKRFQAGELFFASFSSSSFLL